MIAIIDQLDFPTLLKFAQTNKLYNELCATSFKQRNADRKITIENLKFDPRKVVDNDEDEGGDEYENDMDAGFLSLTFESTVEESSHDVMSLNEVHVYDSDNSFEFKSVNMALKTLRLFGNVIQRLKLNLKNANSEVSKLIIQYVNRYCSESLIELEVDIGSGDILQKLSKPFGKLERLSFEGIFPHSKGNAAPMNQTFPALRSLFLSLKSADSSYFDCYFPHLQYLQMSDSNFMDDLLDLNPLNYNIGTQGFKSEILKKMSSMPQLRHLTISGFQMDLDSDLIFESVTNLTIENARKTLKNISFPNLQQLKIVFLYSSYSEWVEFLRAHKNVKQIHFDYSMQMEDGEFESLTSMLHDVEEVFVSSEKGELIGVNTIIKFIQNHKQLIRLHLDTCAETDKAILQSHFLPRWTISNYHNGLSFERKYVRNSN